MKKLILSAGLSTAILMGGMGSAFAAEQPTNSPDGGLGSILGAVNQLVGSSKVDVQSGASLKVDNVTVTAKAVNSTEQSGLTGLISGGVLGGTSGTSASVSYAGYSASTSANGSWGLASSVQSIGGLLNSLGQALK